MKVVTVKMPEELVEAIDDYAIQHGLSRSEVIRAAITQFLIIEHQRQEQNDVMDYNEEVVVIV